MKRKTWVFLGIGAALAAGGAYLLLASRKEEIRWRLAKLDHGNVIQKINATGSVSPVVQVAVGTQVSGVISALYADYNSIVKKGQLIAQIDRTVWETNLKDAEASLERARATRDDAKRQFDRAKRLWGEKLLADQDLEAKQVAYETSSTNFENAKASLERAKANLGYCDITAPVDGVVISRLADVGQTVAASFSTPNLFQIAQDLAQMKVQVNIGESDIDDVKVGQRALFTVDSLPDKQFTATVSLIRQEPVTQSNVVNYVVEMIVPNEVLPGSGSASGETPAAEPRREHRDGGREHAKAATAGSNGGGRPEAGRGGWAGEGAPDPEKAWERMKDRLPAGTTKEEFLKRFKERMAQFQGQRGGRPAPALPTAPANASVETLARTPGGASLLPGPKFTGNLCLRPGMTANVTIITEQKRDVMRVPNAALRFNPSAFLKDDAKKDAPKGGLGQPMGMGMFGPRPGGQGGSSTKGGTVTRREDRIWLLEGGKPKAIVVKAGITDGQFTEITAEGLQDGQQVLVGVESQKAAAGATGAPLGGMPGGRR